MHQANEQPRMSFEDRRIISTFVNGHRALFWSSVLIPMANRGEAEMLWLFSPTVPLTPSLHPLNQMIYTLHESRASAVGQACLRALGLSNPSSFRCLSTSFCPHACFFLPMTCTFDPPRNPQRHLPPIHHPFESTRISRCLMPHGTTRASLLDQIYRLPLHVPAR